MLICLLIKQINFIIGLIGDQIYICMPLIQWIMNLDEIQPTIIRPSRIVNYSIGQIVYDLNGQRWQITDFNAYGSKETEYHVQYGDKRKRLKDSEIITYIDLYSKINCFNELQSCLNDFESKN